MARLDAEQLQRDLAAAHKALRATVEILDSLNSQSKELWFDIGRATGTAKMGLAESGAHRAKTVQS